MGGAVCHCSVSSVFSEVSPKPAALLIEQWHTATVTHTFSLRNAYPAGG